MKRYPINFLDSRERTGNRMGSCLLTILVLLAAWIGSISFDLPSIAVKIIGIAYGQQELPSSGATTPFLEWYEEQRANQEVTNPLAVKITSPEKGQQVPSGQSLIVSGVSSDNSTSDCKVSVIVNGKKPYQPAIARGTGGINDYSTWNFMIKPTYTTIIEGSDNKITSKLECTPNLTKWYSVNVTGIGTRAPLDRAGTVMQPPLTTPVSPFASDGNIPDNDPPLGSPNTGTLPTETVAPPASPSISISVNTPSNPVTMGDDETLEATVLDSVSHSQIDNAILELVVTDSAGNPVDESSDNDGDLSYALDEAAGGGSITPGSFTATLRASATGYEPESKTVTFDLVEETGDGPLSGTESDSDEDSSDNNINDTPSGEESDSDVDNNDSDIGELFE